MANPDVIFSLGKLSCIKIVLRSMLLTNKRVGILRSFLPKDEHSEICLPSLFKSGTHSQ